MRLKRRERESIEIDMSAFADLAFLLIIFFILTTTLEQFIGVKLDIPAGVEKQEQEQAEQLTVSLSQTTIHYGADAEKITLEQLTAALAAENFAERAPNERVVLVDTRDDVPFDRYFKVVTAIANAGGVTGLIKRAGTRPAAGR